MIRSFDRTQLDPSLQQEARPLVGAVARLESLSSCQGDSLSARDAAWLFYDVKFNGTRLMLAPDDDPGTPEFLWDYLDSCDLVAMPRLPIPKRVAPHAGFWCTWP
jgi:hypothetical protein